MMVLYKDGKFTEAAAGAGPDYETHSDVVKAIKEAGYEKFDKFGANECFQIETYRQRVAGKMTDAWLITIWNAVGGYPDILCDNDADFMDLLIKLGPLVSVAVFEKLTDEIEIGTEQAVENWNRTTAKRHQEDLSISGFIVGLGKRLDRS